MTRSVLLDANMLIGAFDFEQGNPVHEASRDQLFELLQNESVKLAITPLIRYEVLRGARNVSIEELSSALDDFQEFDIRGRDARRAAELFQMAARQGRKLERRKFDVFHCVCAESNGLEIVSQDADIVAIQELMETE